ncbi:peptidoglycan glycosyltransferase [Elizabethkingia miricola]|uniref:Peptidoglycan glycosyltransferase n=1 Tax=Elizabethkingia miricola TaxID=172045 RepID=A0ABD4DHD2_ELIMR|nr:MULTISPECIES: transglycosylase domain-containing protein [Elizabethkingia]KUY15699.1 peptidoglycan glycosyltransferase [Elizabethkingia miricola]MCL1652112.1 transglycosylase domain-containing protein [Elizabethkingia miricola]OPC69261.1 peptidoglycan glycosyltransferase [Elizabethkingia miricola]OPC71799.1 peptidoglycan glycosyltransferase [Elizabethkingia miricola]QCO46922.1 peptidoglycan glycosyltransferase [Elizabethkingia sp. 2-6]
MENNTKNKQQSFPLPPKKKKQTSDKGVKRWIKFIWLALAAFVVGIAGLFFMVSQGFLGEMPDVKELENPDIYVASEIISSDGVSLGKFEKEKVIPIKYKDLPPHLIFALQAKEDERFKEHSGIDMKSIFRAVRFGGGRGGGSTITQQLAKLLFTRNVSKNKFQRVFQKLKEWSVAVSLEKRYTKEEIITLYFNKFDFTYNANGIEMASRIYFNKHTNELTLPEAAMFVAMLEAPNANNPLKNPERAKLRRDVVLKQMLDTGYIDDNTYNQAINTPIVTDFHPVKSVNEGYSAYFKFYLRKEIDGYLKDYEKETGRPLNLFRDGLKIYVTLDSRMQKYAEEAIKQHLTVLQKNFDAEQARNPNRPYYLISKKTANDLMMAAVKRTGRYKQMKAEGMSEDSIMLDFHKKTKLTRFTWDGEEEVEMSPWDSIRYHKQIAQAGLMSMEPATGNIKAWVGGINWQHYQYDHVKQGKRQVGSTFKPFVYATAIMNLGYTPCTVVSNANYSKGGWNVRGGRSGGSLALRDALAHSQNAVAARLIESTGVDKVIQLARDLGVQSDIPKNNTIALGSSDITIYEMLGAYSTFANFGTYTKPEMVWRIEDPNGRLIKEVKPESKEVMNEVYAYTMIDMMKGVAEYGTASSGLKRLGINAEIAAKTGTTNNNSDGWFMGITPKLATGVWVGWEDRATHFYSTGEGQGARMALPIWGYFMQRVYKDKSLGITQEDRFVKPSTYDGCNSLKGLGGYGDEGGLQTIDEVRSPRPPSNNGNPDNNGQQAKKEENINDKINKTDDIDFNK